MKTIRLITMILLMASPLFAVHIMPEYHGFTFAKWTRNGNPVWKQAEYDRMISESNCGTHTVTAMDFVPDFPTADQIAITTTVYNCSWDGNSCWSALITYDTVTAISATLGIQQIQP